MTPLYLEHPANTFTRWTGQRLADGSSISPKAVERWSQQERETVRFYEPAEAEAVPDNKISTGQTVQRVDGVVRYVHSLANKPVPTLAERRETIKATIGAYGLALRRAGYRHNFGTEEEPDWQILQLRAPTDSLDDEKNWMSSLSAYTTACVVGQGAIAGAQFRTESNATYLLTYEQGMLVLLAMQGWCGLLMATIWSKSDALNGAHTHAAMDDLEAAIEDGWPGQA